MKQYKKIIVSIFVILALLISTPFIAFVADYSMIKHGNKPIFCSKSAAFLDGGTVICQYKGYQIIKWSPLLKKRNLEIKLYPNYSNLLR